MIVRFLIGAGLFAFGYFIGREIGRAESIRDQLDWATENDELVVEEQNAVADIVTREQTSAGSEKDDTT